MKTSSNKHKNYELLNLLGYGLSKFDNDFISQFGFDTKSRFFEYFVKLGIVETANVVKNRMDLFDPYFKNGRKGWWQKKDVYVHRKDLIDSLFGNETVERYAEIVKLFLQEKYQIQVVSSSVEPIIKSRFKRLQETGLEAELYFINHYRKIDIFLEGILEDARLYGDGYDFQVTVGHNVYLTEIKGIRSPKGRFRMTENEFLKAKEYQNDYVITVILNLDETPKFYTVRNPLSQLDFEEKIIQSKPVREFHLTSDIG